MLSDARLGLEPRLAAVESTDRSRWFRVDASAATDAAHAPVLDDRRGARNDAENHADARDQN
jgi:hypothetical protein